MTDAIVFDIQGIKCDSPTCDYKDMSVEFDPEKFLNAPCPKCEANLFTQADYDTMMLMFKLTNNINDLLAGQADEDDELIEASVEMDGSGVPKFNLKDTTQ